MAVLHRATLKLTVGWFDPAVSRFVGPHISEFMSRIQDLWTAASLGSIRTPEYGTPSSYLDLFRSWLYHPSNTSYETSTWAETRRARALYQYDGTSAGSGKGRRTAMWDATGNSSWTYDQYGRVTSQTRVVDGRSYASDYTFDALDRVREMTYPDGEALTYSYQPNLLLDGIQSSIDSLDIVSDVVYEDIGLPDSYTLGSSPTTASQSFEYWKIDDASRSPFAAIKRIKLSKDSTDLVNRELQYDAVGNVTKIVDGVNSETIDYTYDELNRVLTASVPTGESFAYDTIGNMTSKAGTALDYGTTTPKHAIKSHGTTTYSYDAKGSLTAKGTQTIKYDPEQRPILVQDGSNYSRAAYDGDGVRRKRDDSNGNVHYLGGYERKLADIYNSETVTKYYSASLGAMSRSVAFRRGGTLHWVGSDHLGGTIRVYGQQLHRSRWDALQALRRGPGRRVEPEHRPQVHRPDRGRGRRTCRRRLPSPALKLQGPAWFPRAGDYPASNPAPSDISAGLQSRAKKGRCAGAPFVMSPLSLKLPAVLVGLDACAGCGRAPRIRRR